MMKKKKKKKKKVTQIPMRVQEGKANMAKARKAVKEKARIKARERERIKAKAKVKVKVKERARKARASDRFTRRDVLVHPAANWRRQLSRIKPGAKFRWLCARVSDKENTWKRNFESIRGF